MFTVIYILLLYNQNIKFYELQIIFTSFTLCEFHYLATAKLKTHAKQSGGATTVPPNMSFENLYVVAILSSYFSSWETWKH